MTINDPKNEMILIALLSYFDRTDIIDNILVLHQITKQLESLYTSQGHKTRRIRDIDDLRQLNNDINRFTRPMRQSKEYIKSGDIKKAWWYWCESFFEFKDTYNVKNEIAIRLLRGWLG